MSAPDEIYPHQILGELEKIRMNKMQREIREMVDMYLTLDDDNEFYKMEIYRRVLLESHIRSLIISEKEKVLVSMLGLVRDSWGMSDD